jgi:hypothetical protein
MFWAQFWPNLLATLIGVVAGISGSLWWERRRGVNARKLEERALLGIIGRAVARNHQLQEQALEIANKPQGEDAVPDFAMDVGPLDAVVPRFAQVSADAALVERVLEFHYMVKEVDRKIAMWWGARDHRWGVSADRWERRGNLLSDFRKTAVTLRNHISQVTPLIDARLKTLRGTLNK